LIASLVVVALLAFGLIWWVAVRSAGGRSERQRDTPLPLFAVRTPGRGVAVVGHALAGGGMAAPEPGLGWSGDERKAGTRTPSPAAAPETGAPPAVAVPTPVSGAPAGRATRGAAEAGDEATWAPPAFPAPGRTVQFLPGRLEVVQGRGLLGQEVRFVRPERPGERAVVTFGRGAGAPYRHVQLKVATVSRLHARLSLEPGSAAWMLENLSITNPVAVNGTELHEGGAPRPLADGDRVAMGEVVFIYRAR
jgi:hypothetical protein